jgi:serine/threonine protein kinase
MAEQIELDPKTAAVFKRKKYKVMKKLAEGAFGKVYKAEKMDDQVLSAVKVMDTEKMSDIVLNILIPRELELMTKIRHPNVLAVYDIFKSNGKYYIFMEFAGGGALNKKCEGSLPPIKLRKKWFKQTADALQYMHDELFICHRDIKLENILLDTEGNAKLSDFGFARLHEGGLATTVLGTAPYYSPQLIEGRYDPFKADTWAMGVMLYGMCTGKLAYSAFPRSKKWSKDEMRAWHKTMQEQVHKNRQEYKDLEDKCRDLIDHCLEFNEAKRYTALQILKHKWIN